MIGNVEGFETTGTPRHQIRYRLEICFLDAYQGDLREVEAIREVQQLTSNRADPSNHTAQLERPGESWRGRGSGPCVNPTPITGIQQCEILEKGK